VNKGTGKMLKTKNEGSNIENLGTNFKEPQTKPRRNILRTYMTMSWDIKEQNVMM
jgi:hypothetical protein